MLIKARQWQAILFSIVMLSFTPLSYASAHGSSHATPKPMTKAEEEALKTVEQSIYTIYTAEEEEHVKAVALGSAVAIGEHLLATNCNVALPDIILITGVKLQSRLAQLIYYDDTKDICILEVPKDKLVPAKIRPHSAATIGQTVFAIETPREKPKYAVQKSIAQAYTKNTVAMLQISTPVSTSSNGTGIFDKEGYLMGITTSGDNNGQTINLIIPTALIFDVLKAKTKLLTIKRTTRPQASKERVFVSSAPKPVAEEKPQKVAVKNPTKNNTDLSHKKIKCINPPTTGTLQPNINPVANSINPATTTTNLTSDVCWH